MLSLKIAKIFKNIIQHEDKARQYISQRHNYDTETSISAIIEITVVTVDSN